jgi:hypothetical protein
MIADACFVEDLTQGYFTAAAESVPGADWVESDGHGQAISLRNPGTAG